MKNALQKHDDDDDLLYEDDEPKFEELRFKDLLDVSFIKMNFYRTCKYFSQINYHIGPPSFVYYIHIFLTFMQLISPCFILNSTIIWKSDSFVSFIFQIIFAVSRGWHSDNDDFPRRVITIVCIFVILLFDLLLEFLKHRFQYRQILSDIESKIVISIYKYFIPHLYPFLLCGFPGAITNIVNGHNSFLNYFDVIVGPLFFIYELFKYFNITKRVLFENNPSFSLNSNFLPLTITIISINNLIDCCIIPSEKSTYRIILLIILFIIYLISGIIHMILIPYVSQIYSHLITSVCLSCSVTVLISIICINLNVSIQYFLFVVFIALAIIFYFVNVFITNNSIIKYTRIFEDEMSNFPDCETDKFNLYFKNKLIFFRSIQISLISWYPYFISWKPFRLAYEKWPESEQILITWAKIVSIFPQETNLFDRITKKIIQNPKISLNYRLQFRYILHARITTMIPSLKAFFVSFEKASLHAKNMYKLFFENILSKNTLYFWKNVADISKQVERLDFSIQKNLDSYPNNIGVNLCYFHFLKTIKLDPSQTMEWKKKIELIKTGKKLKADLPYTAALPLYSQLKEIGAQTEEVNTTNFSTDNDYHGELEKINEDDESDNVNVENNGDDDDDDDQFKLSFSSMIKESKIGRITIPVILIIIGTILVLCGFFCFLFFYRNKFINFFYKAAFNVNNIDNSILSCSRLEFFISQLITLLGSDINRTDILKTLAPSLTIRNINLIPPWTFNINDVISLAYDTRDLIEDLPSYFDNFDMEILEISMQSYSAIFKDKCNENTELNCHSLALNSLNEIIELLENSPSRLIQSDPIYVNFMSTMDDFYLKLIDVSYRATMTIQKTNLKELEVMNNIMALSLLLDLILISIPFIFCYFYLGLISHDISQSFITLQSSSLTEIIVKLSNSNSIKNGDESSSLNKYEESNLNKVLPIQQRSNNYSSSRSVYITLFILTFAPIFIPFFVIYFLVQYLGNIENYQVHSLQDITHPVSLVYYLAYLYTQVYNTKFIYSTFESTSEFVERGQSFIKISNAVLKAGLFGTGESLRVINKYATIDTSLDLHSNSVLTELENLLKTSYLNSIDLINSLFVLKFNISDEMDENDEFFFQISYYLTNWAIERRDTPFFTSLFTKIKNSFKKHFVYIIPLFVCMTILQVIIVVFAYFSLLSNLQYFKSALNFFLFFKPSVIIQNDQITNMICEGGVKSGTNSSRVDNFDKILISMPEAVVILDKNLKIIDHNKAFKKLISANDQITGQPLTQFMLYRKCTGFNIDHLKRRLNGLLKGKEEPHFDISFSFSTLQKKLLYVKTTVIGFSQKGSLSNESQYKQIATIALILDDQTVRIIQNEQIKKEQSKIKNGLQKVMPSPVVEEINNSIESLSFSVQSVVIGNVYVETDPFNSSDGFEKPFKFYDDMFSIFDNCLKSFVFIEKLKTFSKVYTFACGLFDDQIKTEKMAEGAIRFALSLIQMQHNFEDRLNRRISLCIGIESGGPVVAGFVSLNRPNFLVVGKVAEAAHTLAVTGVPGKIQISENVQELISKFNFNIQERGESLLINDRRAKTFFVTT